MKTLFWIVLAIIVLFVASSVFMNAYWIFYRLKYVGIGLLVGFVGGYLLGVRRK
ncbi:MAG: hypothetical protein HC906_14710 [Bacteroidales bacterium]|nr:hypothetical protein [Bacteroidales bacterium]